MSPVSDGDIVCFMQLVKLFLFVRLSPVELFARVVLDLDNAILVNVPLAWGRAVVAHYVVPLYFKFYTDLLL